MWEPPVVGSMLLSASAEEQMRTGQEPPDPCWGLGAPCAWWVWINAWAGMEADMGP